MEKIEAVSTKGHYSAAVIHGGIVYVAGQVPIDYEAGNSVPQGIKAQTALVLKNMANVLTRSGTDIEHVLKTTIYLSDVADWPVVNEVYAEFFGKHKPARTIVPVSPLHHGYLLELEAIACLK